MGTATNADRELLDRLRDIIQRSAAIMRRANSTFKAGERFGIINVEEKPVLFFFETWQPPA